MLCNAKEILNKAYKNKYAIAQFNINNLEQTRYILEECNKNNSPVILGVSETAIKYMGGYNVVYSIVQSLIKDLNINIPTVLHLDHGTTLESCINAINAGFTSVMIDASNLNIDDNIKIVKKVYEYASKHNVSVEAEIGSVGNNDSYLEESYYAKVDDCEKLYNNIKIDMLAPAVGSVHGLYKNKPNLDYNRIKEISNKLNIPLVLHGASGIPDNDLKKAIECGISKININTELQIEWSKAIRKYLDENKNIYDPRKIISSGEQNIKESISNKLHLLDCCNRI